MQALSKAKLKLFAGLQLKKLRYEAGLLLAEGHKLLEESLRSQYVIEAVVVEDGKQLPAHLDVPAPLVHVASPADFARLTSQPSPEGVVTVLRVPGAPLCLRDCAPALAPDGPAFVLAAIQDPGNLGTIVRTAEWFGMAGVVCGPGTVDPYNPKALRSSMGSMLRMPLYLPNDLNAWLAVHADKVACADMAGTPLPSEMLQQRPYVLLGNESLGVPQEIREMQGIARVTIPRRGAAESLNAATAAAILAWELCGRQG